jgi:hypothetical protein
MSFNPPLICQENLSEKDATTESLEATQLKNFSEK